MDLLAIDPYVVMALALSLLLMLCVAIMVVMRDPDWAPPRTISRSVWCPTHRQRAVVDFVERTRTGLTLRSVQHCPLRSGGRCHEECCYAAPRMLMANGTPRVVQASTGGVQGPLSHLFIT
jgi:hypothetical protein